MTMLLTLRAYTKTWSGVNLWSGALEWSSVLEWFFGVRIGVNLADPRSQEPIIFISLSKAFSKPNPSYHLFYYPASAVIVDS